VTGTRLVDIVVGQSYLENAFVRWVLAAAVSSDVAEHVIGQHPVTMADRTYRLDFLIAGSRLRAAIELDGFAFHSSKAAFVYDRIRQNDLTSLGFVVLRFSYDAIRDDTSRCVAQLQSVLRSDPALAGYVVDDPIVPVPHDMTPNPLGLTTPPAQAPPGQPDYFDRVRQHIDLHPLRGCQQEAMTALANYYRRGGINAACVMSVEVPPGWWTPS
jgi:very-short-patch-repair endonuclease